MRRLLLSVVVALVALAALPASATPLGNASVERVRVDGLAEAFFGCPAFFSPAGTVCRETHVVLIREAATSFGGPIAKPVWHLFLESYTLEFTSDDPNVPPIGPIDYASGLVDDPMVGFDSQHLSFASLDASVPMTDGSTAVLDATWTPTSDVQVFGNNGPTLEGTGVARHYVDKCVTANVNAHQKLRFATATGTLNGASFRSYSDFPFAGWLQIAHYIYVDVTHGSCV